VRLFLGLGLLQRDDLRLGKHQALLGTRGFQRLEPLVHSLQVVAQPHTAHACGGNCEPALPELVGNADLTEGRLLDRQHYDGILDLLRQRFLNTGFLRLISCRANSPPGTRRLAIDQVSDARLFRLLSLYE